MGQARTTNDQRYWTEQRTIAAQLTADGKSMRDVAAAVGCQLKTVFKWSHDSRFEARVQELKIRMKNALLEEGIASRAERMRERNDRWESLRQVRRERANDPELQRVPGGKTGLIVRKFKQVGTGRDVQLVRVFEVDTGLLSAALAHEKAAAEEMGHLKQGASEAAEVRIRVVYGDEETNT